MAEYVSNNNAAAAMAALTKVLNRSNESYAKSTISRATDAQEGAIHNLIKDADGDGKVSAAENSAHAADLNAHRDTVDADHDGVISFQEELRYGLDNQTVTRKEISVLLATDTNGDGVMSAAEKAAYKMRNTQTGKTETAQQAQRAAKLPA